MPEDEDVLGGGQGFHEDGDDEFLTDPLGADLDLDRENEDEDFDKDH